MANFFLFAISAIICAGAWFVFRGRFGRFGVYLGRFFIAGALVGASSAWGKEEFIINSNKLSSSKIKSNYLTKKIENEIEKDDFSLFISNKQFNRSSP